MPDGEPVLAFTGVSFRVGGTTILDNVSCSVTRGEFVSLIGPNGAGKSTLFRCALNIHTDWTGDIRLHGRPLSTYSQRDIARSIAYVPQHAEALPGFSLSEFVLLGRYARREGFGYSDLDRARVREALLTVELADRADQPVHTLSGGERQRACIAAALAQEPQVLLLDEPVSSLDPHHQAEVLHLLARLHGRDGMTIFCVSHDMNHAIQLSTHILALSGGKVAFTGTPEALLEGDTIRSLFGLPFCRIPHGDHRRPLVFPEGLYA